MEKGKRHHDPLALKFGRGAVAEGTEIDALLKGFEGSGGCDNRGLYNLLVGIAKYTAGHAQIISELVARVEKLEKPKSK